MLSFVNAKINLGLNIVNRRPDGYHDLETIFYPAGKGCGWSENPGDLCDILEVTEEQKDSFSQYGLIADCAPESNLVIKSLNLFREEANSRGIVIPTLRVILEKHIPFGAGLGGGSADASFMLVTLNNLFPVFTKNELLHLANRIGADCPFFIENTPCFATGTGEILHPLKLDLSDYWLGIVKPDVSISTKEAFSHVIPRCPDKSLREIITLPIEEWRDLMVNDFEKSVFMRIPTLRNIKSSLYDAGAIYASMSGSGSAFFGIFRSREEALKAVESVCCIYRCICRLIP